MSTFNLINEQISRTNWIPVSFYVVDLFTWCPSLFWTFDSLIWWKCFDLLSVSRRWEKVSNSIMNCRKCEFSRGTWNWTSAKLYMDTSSLLLAPHGKVVEVIHFNCCWHFEWMSMQCASGKTLLRKHFIAHNIYVFALYKLHIWLMLPFTLFFFF